MKWKLWATVLSVGFWSGETSVLFAADAPNPTAILNNVPAAVQTGTFVDIAILDHLNSKLSQTGDSFRIALARPILFNGNELVPAGVEGKGEIIHAARARAAGKAGELILAARTLDWNGRTIKLRAFAFGQSGQSRVTEGFVAGAIAGPVGFLIAGGEVDVPAGSQAHAKLAEPLTAQWVADTTP